MSETTGFPSYLPLRTIQLRRQWVDCILAALMVILLGGCHRQFYRDQADLEAHDLIDQNAVRVARPPNTAIRVQVDRRSRMFNPFDLDFQPMPMDDPASYQYMNCVDGRRGYPMWEAAGFTNTTESPDWWQFLPMDEDGILSLNLENAVKIALLHSPEYQEQIEQLYLSALQVSAQRFEFDTQFFGGASSFLTADGRRRSGGTQSSTLFSVGPNSNGRRDLSLQRRFAAGGDLVVGVANSIVWELSGPNTQSATTVFDFALVQPLLRSAGRDIILENLTAAERNLLANVRSFERFRRSFFLNITVGRNLESQVAIGSNNIGTTRNVSSNAGGFLGLVQTQLNIRNQEQNITRQAENLVILEDSLLELLTTIPDDAVSIVRQKLQVAQTRQSLQNLQTNLVGLQASYQRSVDQFMLSLGLPPYVCANIDDPLLERFELIDRNLLRRGEQLTTLRSTLGQLFIEIQEGSTFAIDETTGLPVLELAWSERFPETIALVRSELEPLKELSLALVEEDLPKVASDIETFDQSLPRRQAQTEDLFEIYRQEQEGVCGLLNLSQVDESIFELDELSGLADKLREAYVNSEKNLIKDQGRFDDLLTALDEFSTEKAKSLSPRQLADLLRDELILATQNLLADLADDVLTLQLIQARARTESLVLPEVDVDPETAFYVARRNRRDYANAKAAVVDAWRQIEVVADDLESSLDVVFSGDVQNVGNNPTKLRSSTGRLRVGLQWDAPITRLLERNAYRTSLIRYEQTRRDFYQFEDSLWSLLRDEVRQIRASRLTFELGRQAVRIAASQIELNADIRALNDARGTGAGPTAARDAISALNDLLRAQNGLLQIFVNYEVLRRSLDFDMGTMELTPEGLWIDPVRLSTDTLVDLPGTTEDAVRRCNCNSCNLPWKSLPETPVYFEPMTHDEGMPAQMLETPSETPFYEELQNPLSDNTDLPDPVRSDQESSVPDLNEAELDTLGADALNGEPMGLELTPELNSP